MLPHALLYARFLARQFSRSRFNIAGAAPLALCSTMALWHRRLVLPPAGNFSPRKSSQNAPGAAAPGLPLGCAACIPRGGISQAVTLHRAVPPHTASPFPASRGSVESASRCGYRTFLKGRTDCPGTWDGCRTRQLFARFSDFHRRGAHRASVPRSGLCGRHGGCVRPLFPQNFRRRRRGGYQPPACKAALPAGCHKTQAVPGGGCGPM